MSIPQNVFELQPHQETAMLKMHNGCILCGGVGVGKSHTAVAYYLEHEAPKNVYVITTAKKREKFDWQLLFADVGMTRDPETTMGSLVVVDSWNNIDKYKEIRDAFFIFDEQRLVGTGAWVKSFYKIAAANHWVMLSATPGDNWLDYVPVFRANGFIKNITQFKEDHVNAIWTGRYYKVTSYRQVGKLVRWRNAILVDMPYQRLTTRVPIDIPVEYDHELVRKLVKERWHVYENRPLADASELFRVMKRIVYTDTSRLLAVRSLLETHPKLIVFYNHDFELEILRTLNSGKTELWDSQKQTTTPSSLTTLESRPPNGSSGSTHSVETTSDTLSPSSWEQSNDQGQFQVAEWNGHKHEEIPNTESWVYLVQYVAGAEAWECVETDAMCFYSQCYSYKNWHQAHGRIDRLHTSFLKLYYYRLFSGSFLERAVEGNLKAKKSFNEAAFIARTNIWQN